MLLSAEQNYNVAKKKDLASADFNGDGVVDLKSEYVFAHAYYASSFDKGGKTTYLEDITRAFLDGRKLITSANGEKLSDMSRARLMAYVDDISSNWEKVIAESVFKLSLIHISEPTRLHVISYAVFCLKKIFLMIRRPPRSTRSDSSAASDVYKRQGRICAHPEKMVKSLFENFLFCV